jgi:hypothetical protein
MNASTQMTRQHRPGSSRTALVCVLVSGSRPAPRFRPPRR